KVEHIGHTNFGLLIAEILGEKNKTEAAVAHLHTLPVSTEVLGYVD
ncbi:MAG: NIL domain-containing protein, partial [Cardiobacteriaceae bacterium]|nr:NIL domain-containing protein [Cardiobacteriaceae bacterium]